MVERSLHQMDAAQRDLSVFQTLSKNVPAGPYPHQHLFDYEDNRSSLSSQDRTQLDLIQLTGDQQTSGPASEPLSARGNLPETTKTRRSWQDHRTARSVERGRLPDADRSGAIREPMPMAARLQLLQLALSLADRTL